MSRTLKVDFTGIEKEQAHAHELALGVPAKADYSSTPIVTENLSIVKREFPANGWVNWGINPDKPKFPYTPATLRPAKAGQPDTWGTLSEAIRNVKAGKAQGIGYQFDGSGLWGVDLDHAIDPKTKEIYPWARGIIAKLNTYTEISPSGTGFHMIARANSFVAERHKKAVHGTDGIVEIYGADRYFTITGNVFDGRDTINERTEALSSVYNTFLAEAEPPAPKAKERPSAIGTPEKYLKNMLKDAYCQQLWNGERPNKDESKDDFALMCKLLYWTNRDTEKARELFLSSPHVQSKDEKHTKKLHRGGASPYLPRLIEDANHTLTSTAASDDREGLPTGLHTGGGLSPADYPDTVTLKNGTVRPAETLANFKVCLAKYGVQVGYNCLSREIIAPKSFREQYSPVARQAALLSYCQDLCALEQIPKTPSRVAGWLSTVADENKVHPVQRYLEKLPPASGTAEIKHLFSCLELAEAAPKRFSFILVKRWLVQCVAMAYNTEGSYGADGVLVLQGKQGIGKTSFFRALCKPLKGYFKEGAEQNSDKDKLIENTKYWITELGELGRTTLKEIDALKAFITNSADEYRAPYGVSSVKYPRYTSFCGTVNEADFLKEAGRRWWIIPLKDIDLDELKTVDIPQLWAEAYALWRADNNAFRLSKEESQEVERFSSNFERKSAEEQTILDRFDFNAKETLWRWLTTTDIARSLGLPDVVKVGKALKRIKYGEGDTLPTRRYKGSTQYRVPPLFPPSYQ